MIILCLWILQPGWQKRGPLLPGKAPVRLLASFLACQSLHPKRIPAAHGRGARPLATRPTPAVPAPRCHGGETKHTTAWKGRAPFLLQVYR